jgi:uncharacterized protein (TIGR02001 family)
MQTRVLSGLLASSVASYLLWGASAFGADPAPPNPLEPGIVLGLFATTDYMSRGLSNSNSQPAIQPYVEATMGLAYAGIFASNVDYGPGYQGAEIDLYGGVRRWDVDEEVYWFDVGYYHYFYAPSSVSQDYGEIVAKVRRNDIISIGAEIDFAYDYLQGGDTATYVEGNLRYKIVPKEIDLTGAIGYQFFGDPEFTDYLAWNAGIEMSFGEQFKIAVNYADTNLSGNGCVKDVGVADACDTRFYATVSYWVSLLE